MLDSHPPSPPALARPRVWPALSALFLAVPAMIAGSIVVGIVVGVAGSLREGGSADSITAAIEAFFASPRGLLASLVTTQLVFAAMALIPARLSPVPFARRLGLTRAGLPLSAYPVLMVGTLFCAQVSQVVLEALYDGPSESMLALARLYVDAPLLMGLILLAASSLLPGFFEELLCRGYVQRRLLQRFPPFLAISTTSLVFACMHLDPQHVVGVLFTAFWLGYVAWRSDSTWPGIACHTFFNAVLFSMLVFGGVEDVDMFESLGKPWLLLTVPAFAASVYLLERQARSGAQRD